MALSSKVKSFTKNSSLLLFFVINLSGHASAQQCTVSKGSDFSGNDITNAPSADVAACCASCHASTACRAFTWSEFNAQGRQQGTCYLKSAAGAPTTCGTCTAGTVPAGPPTPSPPAPPASPTPAPTPGSRTYPVGVEPGVFIGGFTSGPNQLADVYYPKGPAGVTFPLISFAHGVFSGGTATTALYSSLLTRMASYGYVVVAIDVCASVCDLAAYSADQRRVIDVVRNGGSSLFKLANTTRVGLAGHSFGAGATLLSGKAQRGDVGAIWSMNPCPFAKLAGEIDVGAPLALNTGTLDTVCDPYGVLGYYNEARASSKFYFSLNLATHLEIENGYPERFNDYVPYFFDCHLRGNTDACGRMYGGAGHKGICGDLSMYECHKA